jgi:hypothetical protein
MIQLSFRLLFFGYSERNAVYIAKRSGDRECTVSTTGSKIKALRGTGSGTVYMSAIDAARHVDLEFER